MGPDLDLDCLPKLSAVTNSEKIVKSIELLFIPPQTLFGLGILFSHCPSVRNILFPKYLRVIAGFSSNVCKTNILNKKLRARGQFY